MYRFQSFTGVSLRKMLDMINTWYLEKQRTAKDTEFELDNVWMSTAHNGTEVLIHYYEKEKEE